MKAIMMIGLVITLSGCASLTSFFSFGKSEKPVVVVEKVVLAPVIYGRANLKVAEDEKAAEDKAIALAKQNLNKAVFQHYQKIELVKGRAGATEFELALRKAIYAEIPEPTVSKVLIESVKKDPTASEVSAVVKVTRSDLLKSQMSRLYRLDSRLREHLHATSKGSKLTQLLALLPATPVLFERRLLMADMEAMSGEKVVLPNERLASLMETQFDRLLNRVVISLEAMTPESSAFESGFKKALAQKGFNMSARKPDLTFKYFIELEGKEVIGDIEMLDAASKTYATVSGQYNEQAMDALAKASMNQLVAAMIQSMRKIIRIHHQDINQ